MARCVCENKENYNKLIHISKTTHCCVKYWQQGSTNIPVIHAVVRNA